MVLFLRLGTDHKVGAELSGTGQEALSALAPVSLSCLSRQLEAFHLNSGFQCMSPKVGPGFGTTTCIIKILPAAPVAVGE
jgi:hypothetical protein